jgi:steroid delta-isomerase-like uncharacterized protein
MTESQQGELIRRYIRAYNAFDIEGMLALLSPNIRFENYSGAELTASADGIDEFRRLAEIAKAMFTEREQRVTFLKLDGDEAFADIEYRGRVAADIPGGPAAGTSIELKGTTEFSFRDGRIFRIVDRS